MFAKFLRDKRASKNQTQVEAASEVGVHPLTWSGWECGRRPDRDQTFKVADWAGVSVDELRTYLEEAR